MQSSNVSILYAKLKYEQYEDQQHNIMKITRYTLLEVNAGQLSSNSDVVCALGALRMSILQAVYPVVEKVVPNVGSHHSDARWTNTSGVFLDLSTDMSKLSPEK